MELIIKLTIFSLVIISWVSLYPITSLDIKAEEKTAQAIANLEAIKDAIRPAQGALVNQSDDDLIFFLLDSTGQQFAQYEIKAGETKYVQRDFDRIYSIQIFDLASHTTDIADQHWYDICTEEKTQKIINLQDNLNPIIIYQTTDQFGFHLTCGQ